MTLDDLVSAVHQEAGFEVFVHSGDREDLNDYEPEATNNYRRALHNVKNPEPHYGELLPVKDSIGGSIGYSENGEWRMTDFDVVAYGKLKQYHIKQTVSERRFPRREAEYIAETRGCKLRDLINTNSQEDAHFISLTLRALIFDGSKRYGCIPTLSIVGTNELIENLAEFIKENPKKYMDLVRGILPKNKFPKVNDGIVDAAVQGDSIVMLPMDEIDTGVYVKKSSFKYISPSITHRVTGFNQNLKESTYDSGKRIPL